VQAVPVGRRAATDALVTLGAWCLTVLSAVVLTAKLWTESYSKRIDFHLYMGAVARWPGHSLYSFHGVGTHLGFTYPPFAALALWPVARLPSGIAEHLWLVATVACSVAFVAVAANWLPRRPRGAWFPPMAAAVGIWTVPIVFTVRIGQINAFLCLAVLLDAIAAIRRRRGAGVATGVAAAVKLTPIVAVLFFAATRRWQAARTAVVTFVGCALLAALASPSDSWRYWTVDVLASNRIGRVNSRDNDSLRRLISLLPIPNHPQALIWLGGVAALGIAAAWRARIAHERGNDLAALTLAMAFAAAASPISWAHHLYFLIPAVLLVLGDLRSPARWVAGLLLAAPLFELVHVGQQPIGNVLRAISLLVVIVALPIDRSVRAERGAPARSRSAAGVRGVGASEARS
jgi:alpha-1,2-mannosyltransferase